MYVAVSQLSSHVYKLAGFDSAESDFAKLISETPEQRIETIYGAESRGLLCAEIVYGLSPSWWVGGESSVKLQAAEHFFAEAHPDGLLLAANWWKTAKGDRKHLKIFTEAKGDGYQLNLPIFWAPVEGHSVPEVKLYQIEVTRDGACSNPVPPSVILR